MSGQAVRLTDAVLLTGSAIEAAAYAVNVARAKRAEDRHQPSPALEHLAKVLAPVCPRADMDSGRDGQDELMDTKSVAQVLGIDPRSVRRIADRLDGRNVGNRWLYPRRAGIEHLEGRTAS